MRYLQCLLLVAYCCVICSGCGAAKIKELTAEVESLQAETAKLKAEITETKAEVAETKAENARLESELGAAKQELARVEKIKKGYETARTKLTEQMKQFAPLLGNAGSPLPPFDELEDSSWAGEFAPAAKLAPGIKDLEKEIKELLGDQGIVMPDSKPDVPGPKPQN
jgi:chromosome segregation ATPase